MSSSLHLYLLHIADTRALVGSRDDSLVKVMRQHFADDLDRDNEHYAHEIGQGAPTAETALHAVVHGGPFSGNRQHTFQYGHAYERLCSFIGEFLPNDCFTPHRGDWLSVVDQELGALGVTAATLEALSEGGPPAPLPYTSTPSCGEWTSGSIAQALAQYEATTRRGTMPADRTPTQEPEVVKAVTQCLDWMRRANAFSGFGVIGFRS
ncbi:hypothetical protein AB0M23_16285 [Streptomyces sp. NPDC052077]|uniref:DUF7691 family protein n=1 Tax=Streptomyces sp. NPDC052077 TaxID=3154757 RepID=UPI0034180670